MSLLDYKKVLREDVEFFNRYKHIYSDDISKLFEKLKIPVAYRIKLKNRLLELYDEIYIKPEEPENIQLLVEEIIGSDINRKLLIAVPYSRITANYLNYLLRDFNKVDVNKIYAIHALQAFVFYILNKIVKKLEEKLLQQIAQEFQNYLLTLQNKLPIEDKETFFKLIMEIIKQLHPEVSKNEELQRGIKQLVSESKTEVKQKKETEIVEKEEQSTDLVTLAQIENIFSNLKYIKEIGDTVVLKSYYKGLPVECEADIEDLDPVMNIAYLNDINCKFRIFYLQGYPVYIYHEMFNQPVLAKVFKSDAEKGKIILSDLRYGENIFERRKSIRVELDKKVKAEIFKDNQLYKGIIKDISQNGAKIVFPEDTDLKEGDLIQFKTAIGKLNIETPAIVRRVESNGRLVGIEFKLPYSEEKQLLQYIMQRQQDILNEIKLTFNGGEIS
jgi:hypothetical protein